MQMDEKKIIIIKLYVKESFINITSIEIIYKEKYN